MCIWLLRVVSCRLQRPIQRGVRLLLDWTQRDAAGWADPKHWAGACDPRHPGNYADPPQPRRVHGALREGISAAQRLETKFDSWCLSICSFVRFCLRWNLTRSSVIDIDIDSTCMLVTCRVRCRWTWPFWARRQWNVERLQKPFTTRRRSFTAEQTPRSSSLWSGYAWLFCLAEYVAENDWLMWPSLCQLGIGPNSTWLIASRLDTFVELCCSNMADKEQGIVLTCTSLFVFMLLHTQILFVPSNEINKINIYSIPINWWITYIS